LAVVWEAREKSKIKPAIARTVLIADPSLVIAFCHVVKEKIRNEAITIEKTERMKVAMQGLTKNRTTIRGNTIKKPNKSRKGVQMIAGRAFFRSRELKQPAEYRMGKNR
jgi:hypothetical protein